MSRRPNGRPSKSGSYPQRQLRQTISDLLPRGGLPILPKGIRQRWTLRLLVMCAILLAWQPGQALKDRFAEVRWQLVAMHPGRRRPGATYEGFIAALARVSEALVALVTASLRAAVRAVADEASCWTVAGVCVFGVDGTKIDCPMTQANEKELGLASRSKSWPQVLLTTMFHVGTGLPWSFVRGGARDSERSHLLQMLAALPANAMLLADAGFTGYDLLKAVLDAGHALVIRVGSNVRLLKKLGYACREHDGVVYLWPDAKQKRLRPLVLRLVTVHDGKKPVHLLTSVLDDDDDERQQLSERAIAELYRRRWGVELLFRSLKQTLGRRKMLSDSPGHAKVELDWTMIGLWVLDLINARAAGGQARRSVASSLRAVRGAAAGRGGALGCALAAAVLDRYERRGSKKARHWPHKKREKPPGEPKARMATPAEVELAAVLKRTKVAA